MLTILPGRPQSVLQAVSTGKWEEQHIIVYISGPALVISNGPRSLLQTIYTNDEEVKDPSRAEGAEELQAVVLDSTTGKIACASPDTVHVYTPRSSLWAPLSWSLQASYTFPKHASLSPISCLSWGSQSELLVGSSSLTLLSAYSSPPSVPGHTLSVVWSKPLANPVGFALFSPDTSLIATTGRYDRLVKIWRRLSYGTNDEKFDYDYLRHAGAVTSIEWHTGSDGENVLYTCCVDRRLRVWTPMNGHRALGILSLWGDIDLQESIQPRSLKAKAGHQQGKRFTFVLAADTFASAVQGALQVPEVQRGARHARRQSVMRKEQEAHALMHIKEVARRKPSIVVVLDDRGGMSAWGLEKVGCKARNKENIFNVAHVHDMTLDFEEHGQAGGNQARFHSFVQDGKLTILVHHFDGKIEWLESDVYRLLDPSPRQDRTVRYAVWTGHSVPVKSIVRSATGDALASFTNKKKGIVWKKHRRGLTKQCEVYVQDSIEQLTLLMRGKFALVAYRGKFALLDVRGARAVQVAEQEFEASGRLLSVFPLGDCNDDDAQAYVCAVSANGDVTGALLKIDLRTQVADANEHKITHAGSAIEKIDTFQVRYTDAKPLFFLPVDRLGLEAVSAGGNVWQEAISCTNDGSLTYYDLTIRPALKTIQCVASATIETNISSPSLISANYNWNVAVVASKRMQMSIWDMHSGCVEYEETFRDSVQDLDWTSTSDMHSLLAVGFAHHVIVYSQLRYDYLTGRSPWAAVRLIDISNTTPHPLGDSLWLDDDDLVTGVGNQLLVHGRSMDARESLVGSLGLEPDAESIKDIFQLNRVLNSTLPVFHPQLLAQMMLLGKSQLAQQVLLKLGMKLKFWTESEAFQSMLGIPVELLHMSRPDETSTAAADLSLLSGDVDESCAFDETAALELRDRLSEIHVPYLSSCEQERLSKTVSSVGTMAKHMPSMDENASRYLFFFQDAALRDLDSSSVSWREIAFASHSSSQDVLTDLVSRHCNNKLLWKNARESGIFMWLSDTEAVRAQFEVIARNEYTKSDERNPIDCALFYLALKKKAVLSGLWRTATWHREQAATLRMLSNNFADPRWKTAALKNAYALLGKRRFEYAASWFLLAGYLKDAISVLASDSQVGDLQLAIAICRIWEGDQGTVLKELLDNRLLPEAVREDNRWKASWGLWMLGRKTDAVKALITTKKLSTLIAFPGVARNTNKSYLTDDPAFLVLYQQLRSVGGVAPIAARDEWDLVLHTARLYRRMGCDVFALDLVRSWQFSAHPTPMEQVNGHTADDHQVTAGSSVSLEEMEPRVEERTKTTKQASIKPVFEEPSASSLLDSFGF